MDNIDLLSNCLIRMIVFHSIFISGVSANVQMVCTIMDQKINLSNTPSYNAFGKRRFKLTTPLSTYNF